MEQIQAIDTMCRPFYCDLVVLKKLFETYEMKVAASTTLGGIAKRLGLKPGEEWRVLQGHSSLKDMIAEMDEIGVERVFMDQMVHWSYRESRVVKTVSIEYVARLVDESRGRIIGGVGYNPNRINESLNEIERAVKEHGFKYVWFHPTTFGLRPSDKKCYPLYAKCVELGIPCCYQSGQSAEPLPSEPGHPMYADEVALDFPELKLVLTHTGWPWVDEWISMVWRHPNVYGNIGAYFPSTFRTELVKFMDSGAGRDKIFGPVTALGLPAARKSFGATPS